MNRGPPPLALVLGIGEPVLAPPLRGAREHAGPLLSHTLVERRQDPLRLGDVDQPHLAGRLRRAPEPDAVAVGLDPGSERCHAVPVAPVDRRLRRPEDGQGLAALTRTIQLAAHQPRHRTASPMARRDPDEGQTGRRQLTAGNRQGQRNVGGGSDHRPVLVRGEHPIGRQHALVLLHVLVLELVGEARSDDREPAVDLLRRGYADLDAHGIRSSGA